MLCELAIEQFAIIDRLRLSFEPGFNVLTGETGAGKSIIIDAVNLLLGSRADTDMIRTGSDQSRIEAVFELSPALSARLQPLLDEYGLAELNESVVILTREINREGRNVCRVNGRTTTLTILQEIARLLVDIHGQGENQSLLRVRQHVHFLDRYAELSGERERFAAKVRELNQTRREMRTLRQDEREMARRADLLEYQIEEIDAAGLDPEEEEELLAERNRLANAERLIRLSSEAHQALTSGEEDTPAAMDAVNAAMGALENLERLDAGTAPIREMLEEAAGLLDEAGLALRDYRDELEYNPDRLEQVEERVELIRTLQRKYGASIEAVLAYQQEAIEELEGITHHEERMNTLETRERALLKEVGQMGLALSEKRQAAARDLEAAIEAELQDLRMTDARFLIDFSRTPDPDGAIGADAEGEPRWAFDETGLDRIEFLIAPNIGEAPKPLTTTASGGETSRLMLAMKSVLSAADQIPTLIFDEIDAGIGGRIGHIVGRKLWNLTSSHQVLCVTHLPQMAAFGDTHYQITKETRDGRSVTSVQPLEYHGRVEELTMMLGGPEAPSTTRSAEELLLNTEALKQAALHGQA